MGSFFLISLIKVFDMRCLFIFTVLSVLFTACASPYVARLEPETENFSYRNGEKLVAQTDGQAKVTLSYFDSSPKYVVFHLEVENVSNVPFDFDPASCLLVGDAGPVRQAIDPEVQLLSMDIESARKGQTINSFDLASLAATVAETVLAAAQGVTDPNFYASVGISAGIQLSFLPDDNGEEEAIARGQIDPLGGAAPAPDNRYFWLDDALRITTIEPGRRVFGKVAFPRNDEAENLIFKVMVQEQEFSFSFNQKLFQR
jgi:hypothetical protein